MNDLIVNPQWSEKTISIVTKSILYNERNNPVYVNVPLKAALFVLKKSDVVQFNRFALMAKDKKLHEYRYVSHHVQERFCTTEEVTFDVSISVGDFNRLRGHKITTKQKVLVLTLRIYALHIKESFLNFLEHILSPGENILLENYITLMREQQGVTLTPQDLRQTFEFFKLHASTQTTIKDFDTYLEKKKNFLLETCTEKVLLELQKTVEKR